MSKKIIVGFLGVAMIAIALISTFIIFTYDKSPAEDINSIPLDTSNWQTYRNEEFGFELKYPPQLIGFERTYSNVAVGGINFRISTETRPCPFESYIFNGRRFFAQFTPDPCKPPETIFQKRKVIGGVTFTRSEIGPSKSIIYTGKHNDVCYRLSYRGCPGKDESFFTETDIQLFEEIVATFKLLK